MSQVLKERVTCPWVTSLETPRDYFLDFGNLTYFPG
jgi:hypothetical protein